MLNHEAAVEQAKKGGTPAPEFEIKMPTTTMPQKIKLPAEMEKAWKEKLDQLPAGERAVEEAVLRADYQMKTELAKDMDQLYASRRQEKEKAAAEGKSTASEGLMSLFSRGK